jgi:hypothetical protein
MTTDDLVQRMVERGARATFRSSCAGMTFVASA